MEKEMSVKEAIKLTKKAGCLEWGVDAYAEYKDLYLLHIGSPETYTSVNKYTGEVDTLWVNALMFEHLDDEAFCRELNDVVMNLKPIS